MTNQKTLQNMIYDLATTGSFRVSGDDASHNYLDKVLPGAHYLGDMNTLLGYEPDNYYLFGAYEFEGKIVVYYDASNQWTGYSILDETKEEDAKFANEIRAGYQRIQALKAPTMTKFAIFQMPGFLSRFRAFLFDSTTKVYFSEYVCVWRGDIESEEMPQGADTPHELESLFRQFNINHPANYGGKSMSPGDVVMIDEQYYLCCSFGFAKLDKDAFFSQPPEMNKKPIV